MYEYLVHIILIYSDKILKYNHFNSMAREWLEVPWKFFRNDKSLALRNLPLGVVIHPVHRRVFTDVGKWGPGIGIRGGVGEGRSGSGLGYISTLGKGIRDREGWWCVVWWSWVSGGKGSRKIGRFAPFILHLLGCHPARKW